MTGAHSKQVARDPPCVTLSGNTQTVKMGVQYSLWGGSVMNLGTERHKKQYFDDIDKFVIPGKCSAWHIKHAGIVKRMEQSANFILHAIARRPDVSGAIGCFCMTELGHGSNVAALQTECILDTTSDEWIVNTPDDSAIKWYATLWKILCLAGR